MTSTQCTPAMACTCSGIWCIVTYAWTCCPISCICCCCCCAVFVTCTISCSSCVIRWMCCCMSACACVSCVASVVRSLTCTPHHTTHVKVSCASRADTKHMHHASACLIFFAHLLYVSLSCCACCCCCCSCASYCCMVCCACRSNSDTRCVSSVLRVDEASSKLGGWEHSTHVSVIHPQQWVLGLSKRCCSVAAAPPRACPMLTCHVPVLVAVRVVSSCRCLPVALVTCAVACEARHTPSRETIGFTHTMRMPNRHKPYIAPTSSTMLQRSWRLPVTIHQSAVVRLVDVEPCLYPLLHAAVHAPTAMPLHVPVVVSVAVVPVHVHM